MGVEKFLEIALKEDETTQKILELKKTKAKGVADKEIAKVKSKADIEMNRDKLKVELASKKHANKLEEKKLKLKYKFKMAKLQACIHTSTQVPHVSHHAPAHSATAFTFPGPSSTQAQPMYHNTPAPQGMTEELHSEDIHFDTINYNQEGDNDSIYK
jgi:hypothetical protein